MAVSDGVYRQSKKVRQLYHYPPKIQQRAVELGITTAYHSAYKNGMKHMGRYDKGQYRKIKKEYKQIVLRAKNIGKPRLLKAYFMGAYFITRNRGDRMSGRRKLSVLSNGFVQISYLRYLQAMSG